MSPTKAAPLTERSPNAASPSKPPSPGKLALEDADRAMPRFEPRPQRGECMQNRYQNMGNQTYISPSDAIRSPTTKKLSEIKGRRFMNAKPQTLFAKTLAKENLKAHAQGQDETQH
ncbi:uncharacterized protein Z519_02514 [Cladophialophora bantiana CBS 173.52]|uniref:Spo12 family protein n=1 Tax=Cladophialophora bantiana (strain ATCC 10958 / CBS 173.52 / CDC B-1940 / NIH 8579) TaxID=1442370 RepID=A0A0D2GFH9_CLAB1|nr:uncharacterized protein Z519_02514 [Cladophialophora bantiana CBS 173.52]KIW97122.1 hypothetical protein Z519_02514 [Cladophialophora bantiana CBS 173.52]